MPTRDDQPRADAWVDELRELLRGDEPSVGLPPWFTTGLMHEVGRSRRERLLPDGWGRWLAAVVGIRVLGPALVLALVVGGWIGYRGGTAASLHLAEVRYVDEIDPVHMHP